ncbi:ribosomal protein S5 domain 2-type protein [Armillaria novae-zelandiae]|uniref:Ribosomal protein S5 domain 2-type protein n=1 Tax=Armillaria novae-zelandiae TaxID=153914 RepID=A0AA39TJ78_9AGAR|nr:ribosomal protein S5 domain 2-type protein [Armillaria novae-zelandiae]
MDASDAEELDNLILTLQNDREPVASELEVLKSIYGDDSLRIWHPPEERSTDDTGTVRYEIALSFPSPHDEVSIKVLVSLPPSYPSTSTPQLQLLSRYIGAFGIDSGLFGSVLKTFISINGVEWIEDSVCVFDGLQNVLDRCVEWYEDHLSADKAGELLREDGRESTPLDNRVTSVLTPLTDPAPSVPVSLPKGVEIFVSEPITDRRSSFIGRACSISDPSMLERHIRLINAWRCEVGGLLHQDNDDDGETAAGGRLSHLLQILVRTQVIHGDINNVLVIVTRYFGGIHLGPDRFKHINQAARNALELGGFLDEPASEKDISPWTQTLEVQRAS